MGSPDPCTVPRCKFASREHMGQTESNARLDVFEMATAQHGQSAKSGSQSRVEKALVFGDVMDAGAHHLTWRGPPLDDDQESQTSCGECESPEEVISSSAALCE